MNKTLTKPRGCFNMSSLKEVIQALTNRKPHKLFYLLNKLPSYGVGRQFTRVIWKYDEVTSNYKNSTRWGDPLSYWTITRVKPDGVSFSLIFEV